MESDRKLNLVLFHIWATTLTYEYVEDIMEEITNSGLYAQCDHILVRIRYDTVEDLNKMKEILAPYDKVKIVFDGININYNNSTDGTYSDEILEFFKPCEFSRYYHQTEKSMNDWVLGEVESVIEFFNDPQFRKYYGDNITALFIHTKSSRPCYFRDSLNEVHKLKLLKSIRKWESYFDILKTQEACTLGLPNMFLFKTRHVSKFSIEEMLKDVLLRYLDQYPNNIKWDWRIYGVYPNPDTGKLFFGNRHTFSGFCRKYRKLLIRLKV